MAASRFFQCRNLLTSNLTLMSTLRWTPKTFSIVSLTRNISQKSNILQSFKILSKPKIKIEFLTRTKATSTTVSDGFARKLVGIWLITCGFLVHITLVLGGYTRLTESGLSMVNWRLTFEKFPSDESSWLEEFKKYQEYPEFKMLKKDITLEEFKKIFITEYIHRSSGRVLGVCFAIPAVVFWLTGCFKKPMKKRIVAFSGLILIQGLMGWYMVKSGLENRFEKQSDIPRVSQYRLATHLGLALTLYIGFILSAMDSFFPVQKIQKETILAGARKIRMFAHSCKGLVFLTAISGAFVAGLDAGLVYNSFPKMSDRWIPDDIFAMTPFWKNFTENPTTVQFEHRLLGVSTFSLIMATWLLSRKKGLPKRAQIAINTLAIGALCQVGLGISTLVHLVPINLALGHQSGSVLLLAIASWLSHELKFLKYVPK